MGHDATSRGSSGLRPPLKWAGGKRWLVPNLRELWEPFRDRRLVEPFCGGLGISLGLRPETVLLNDANEHLINFYLWLKQGLEVSVRFTNTPAAFYRNRTTFNALLRRGGGETNEAASLFYYLNRTGYNGLCRFNQSGEFNVPFGRYRTIAHEDDFSAYKQAFARWEFVNKDFEDIDLSDEDFVYADPPYDTTFAQYSRGGFSWDDQVRVATWLSRHKGQVVLSNQATDRIEKLYRQLGFDLQFVEGPRMISCNGNRKRAREVLATRNL